MTSLVLLCFPADTLRGVEIPIAQSVAITMPASGTSRRYTTIIILRFDVTIIYYIIIML